MKEESNLTKTDLDERLEKLSEAVKKLQADAEDEIKEIRFVEVLFDKAAYKVGEEKVNLLLRSSKKTGIVKQFQTESGLVIEIGTWGKKNNEKLS